MDFSEEEQKILVQLNLLTSKSVLYVCNVAEEDAATGNALTESVFAMAKEQNAQAVIISAEIEAQISQLDEKEAQEFLETLGLTEPGLNRLIRAGYDLLQ